MFIDNKYKFWYFNICDKAKGENRTKNKNIYYEKHHILPRSLGGTNDKENLVLLTSREHFLCHWLLTKFTIGASKRKMLNAFSFFTTRNLSSKAHEIVCLKNSIAKKGKNNPMYGATPWNKGLKGEYLSEEARKRVSEGHKNWLKAGGNDAEYREKISKALKGKSKPEGFGNKISNSISGVNHWSFKGYYCTPFGKFPNSTAIEHIISNQSVRQWCKNSSKKITKNSYSQVKYLQSLGESVIGKTFHEIGFYYEYII